jgi:hypothetical protein
MEDASSGPASDSPNFAALDSGDGMVVLLGERPNLDVLAFELGRGIGRGDVPVAVRMLNRVAVIGRLDLAARACGRSWQSKACGPPSS